MRSECVHGERAATLRALGARVILDLGVGAIFTFRPPLRAPHPELGREPKTNSVATMSCVIPVSLSCLQ